MARFSDASTAITAIISDVLNGYATINDIITLYEYDLWKTKVVQRILTQYLHIENEVTYPRKTIADIGRENKINIANAELRK